MSTNFTKRPSSVELGDVGGNWEVVATDRWLEDDVKFESEDILAVVQTERLAEVLLEYLK